MICEDHPLNIYPCACEELAKIHELTARADTAEAQARDLQEIIVCLDMERNGLKEERDGLAALLGDPLPDRLAEAVAYIRALEACYEAAKRCGCDAIPEERRMCDSCDITGLCAAVKTVEKAREAE